MSHRSNNPPPSPPHRHHYIPSFYLSRWATGNDGRLCQYSRPHNSVVRNRKHPTATGFADKLYELRGLEDDLANAVETKFFSACRQRGSRCPGVDGNGGQSGALGHSPQNWMGGISPLATLARPRRRSLVQGDLALPHECRRARSVGGAVSGDRKPGDAATFQEHMANLPADTDDRSAMNALVSMMDGGNVAKKIHYMLWHVIDTSDADFDFLTSDRPLIRTNGLMIEGGHLAIPIGPRKLFVAARDEAALRPILAMSRRQLVRECNRQMCDYAVKFVYGVDDSQLSFVAKYFATKDQPRLAQASLKQRQEMAATMLAPPKSPQSSPKSG